MHRTRLVAMAVLVPVVAAVVAAVIVAAVTGTAVLAVTDTSAGPSGGGFRQDGGNRGWEASAPLSAPAPAEVS